MEKQLPEGHGGDHMGHAKIGRSLEAATGVHVDSEVSFEAALIYTYIYTYIYIHIWMYIYTYVDETLIALDQRPGKK